MMSGRHTDVSLTSLFRPEITASAFFVLIRGSDSPTLPEYSSLSLDGGVSIGCFCETALTFVSDTDNCRSGVSNGCDVCDTRTSRPVSPLKVQSMYPSVYHRLTCLH